MRLSDAREDEQPERRQRVIRGPSEVIGSSEVHQRSSEGHQRSDQRATRGPSEFIRGPSPGKGIVRFLDDELRGDAGSHVFRATQHHLSSGSRSGVTRELSGSHHQATDFERRGTTSSGEREGYQQVASPSSGDVTLRARSIWVIRRPSSPISGLNAGNDHVPVAQALTGDIASKQSMLIEQFFPVGHVIPSLGATQA